MVNSEVKSEDPDPALLHYSLFTIHPFLTLTPALSRSTGRGSRGSAWYGLQVAKRNDQHAFAIHSASIPSGPAKCSTRIQHNAPRRLLCTSIAAPLVLLCLSALAFRGAVACWTYPIGISTPPTSSTWIETHAGEPLAAFASCTGQWQLPLSEKQISPHLLDAIVAVEDVRFYEHGGVDWRSVGGALVEDIASRRARRGASTITMQLPTAARAGRSIALGKDRAGDPRHADRSNAKQAGDPR